jgi:hypothetical protein
MQAERNQLEMLHRQTEVEPCNQLLRFQNLQSTKHSIQDALIA